MLAISLQKTVAILCGLLPGDRISIALGMSVYLANYALKADVVCLQIKLCDPHLSALKVRFSRRGAIQIYIYVYIYLYHFVCLYG